MQETDSLTLFDIVPYSPGAEAARASEIRAVAERTGLSTFLYCVSLDPRGRPAFDNVRAATASFRALRAALGDAPVRLGFLLQSVLGHWDRADAEIEPWQRSVDETGAERRFCVLDPCFAAYIRDLGAALAAEKPCFVLTDDDIRAFSPRLECFCPLHTAAFNRRAGTSFTPEAYRAAAAACHVGDPIERVVRALKEEIPATVVRLLREGLDSVDPTIPAGCCMPAAERLSCGGRARAIAAPGQASILRLANGRYAEMSRDDLLDLVVKTQALISYHGDAVDRYLDESDTFPYTLYARSGNSFLAKLALGIFNGARGAKLWYVGMRYGTERVPEAYEERLGAWRRGLEALARALDGSMPTGVRLPAVRPPVPLRSDRPDFLGKAPWLHGLLGLCGIPFTVDFGRGPGDPVVLGGAEAIDRLDDSELATLFRGRVFVDGPAALRLAARGFTEALGCRPVVETRAFNVEERCDTHERPPIVRMASVPALAEPAPDAEVCSELRFSKSVSTDPETAFVAPASVFRRRTDGGAVFVSSFDVDYPYTAQNLRRKAFFVAALRRLDPAFEVVCESATPTLALARRCTDGKTVAIAVNTGYDHVDAFSFSTARSMAAAERLDEDGVWRAAGATEKDGIWTIRADAPCMGFVVVRW